MKMATYLDRLQHLTAPSDDLQTYIDCLAEYIQAGGAMMDTSDEIWLEFCIRNNAAWNALPQTDQTRARTCAFGL
jgi:hypothetical protein